MTATGSRKLAIEYLRCLERNDFDGALSLTTPDAMFRLSGPGDMNRAQVRAFFEPVGKMIEHMSFTIVGCTVEGERVALEARGEGTLTNGRIYRNRYHFLFIVRGGKISSVREYADSAPAQVTDNGRGARSRIVDVAVFN